MCNFVIVRLIKYSSDVNWNDTKTLETRYNHVIVHSLLDVPTILRSICIRGLK